MSPFRQLEHTADMAVEVRAPTLRALFEEAARGAFALAEGELSDGVHERRHLSLQEEDEALLLRRFLAELLYWYDAERFFTTRVAIGSVTRNALEADIEGVRVEHGPLPKIPMKAVTYHNLSAQQEENGEWVATVVFDV